MTAVQTSLDDSPNGPTSRATCRLCGAEREFRNAWNSVTCAHCGRAFGSRSAMVSHVRAAHQGGDGHYEAVLPR